MNEHSIAQIDSIITNFLLHQASTEECRTLELWLAQDKAHQAYFVQCSETFFAASAIEQHAPFDPATGFHLFRQRTAQQTNRPRRTTLRRVWIATTACMTAACLALGFYWLGQRDIEAQFRPVVIETPLGAHLKIVLPDSSLLFLNSNSRVSYSQGFGVSNRNIELQGEGYFEAAHNPDLPLRVHTKGLVVEVLGTKFSVTNYNDRPEAYINLVEGSVMFCDETRENWRALQPNELATFDKATQTTTIKTTNAQERIGWINGELHFNDEPLSAIIVLLEQTYGVEIELTDPALETLCFYASFAQSQTSAEQILNTLSRTGKITYTRQGNRIAIAPATKK